MASEGSKRTSTQVQEREQQAAEQLPAAFNVDRPPAPLAVRPVRHGEDAAAVQPRYPACRRAAVEAARDSCAASSGPATERPRAPIPAPLPSGSDDDFDVDGGGGGGGEPSQSPDGARDLVADQFGSVFHGIRNRRHEPAALEQGAVHGDRCGRLPDHPAPRSLPAGPRSRGTDRGGRR